MYLRWGSTSATFPDGGSLTLFSGIYPSTVSLGIPPPEFADDVERIATLTIGDGESPESEQNAGNKLVFPGCRIADGSLHRDIRNARCSFVARDFRWRWAMAQPISGEYNRRDRDGYIVGTKMTALEMVWKLYDLLPCPCTKEQNHLLAMPDDQYPYVNWDNANPAEAMAEVCELFSLVICPALGALEAPGTPQDGDQVVGSLRLHKIGEGAAVPETPFVELDDPLLTIDIPATLRVVGGKTIEQRSVSLTAVGLDPAAGEYRALDSASLVWYQAEYYPGFEREISDDEERRAADETAFRAYRLPDNITIGTKEYSRAEAMRRIRNHLITKDSENSENRYLPAYVIGEHAADEALTDPEMYFEVTTKRVDVGFWIAEEHGLIIFNRPVFAVGAVDHDLIGATLTLHCSWEVETYTRDYFVGGGIEDLWGTLQAPEVFYEYAVDSEGAREVQNKVITDASATLHVEAFALRWKRPETVTSRAYAGIVPVMPDGAVEQVTWSVSEGGPATRITWGAEHDLAVPPRNMRDRDRDLNDPVRAKRAQGVGVRLDAAGFDEAKAEVTSVEPQYLGEA